MTVIERVGYQHPKRSAQSTVADRLRVLAANLCLLTKVRDRLAEFDAPRTLRQSFDVVRVAVLAHGQVLEGLHQFVLGHSRTLSAVAS